MSALRDLVDNQEKRVYNLAYVEVRERTFRVMARSEAEAREIVEDLPFEQKAHPALYDSGVWTMHEWERLKDFMFYGDGMAEHGEAREEDTVDPRVRVDIDLTEGKYDR